MTRAVVKNREMLRRIADGAIAGAVGTLTLEAVSYVDMLVQDRAASSLPADAAGDLAARAGVELTDNRRSALGALLGYSTGTAVGVAVALVATGRGRPLRRGALVGAMAIVAANGPMVAQGLTDPRTWGPRGWASDVVPHLAYGVATVAVLDRLRRPVGGRDH